MPLSSPAPREPLHSRRITCEGFRRKDGLVEIEGHIIDVRPFPYHHHWDHGVVDGTPIHEMWLRLVLDDSKKIVDVEVALDNTPFPRCKEVDAHYKRLVGLTIGAGFSKRMFDLVGADQGCTHVTGLLQSMATTLLQALASEAQRLQPTPPGVSEEALMAVRAEKIGAVFRTPSVDPAYPLLNSCYSHAAVSPVVKRLSPQHYAGEEGGTKMKKPA
ncbi:MAG: DUF2889 domain-containing protein [Rhodocyclaceae bacterium]|nr:MAG: DUF2889 domain-containing protein [Rhodocyclaceae bacterium]